MQDRIPKGDGTDVQITGKFQSTPTTVAQVVAQLTDGSFSADLQYSNNPTQQGTPYNVANVLPAGVVSAIGDNSTNPTLATALNALASRPTYETVTSNGWTIKKYSDGTWEGTRVQSVTRSGSDVAFRVTFATTARQYYTYVTLNALPSGFTASAYSHSINSPTTAAGAGSNPGWNRPTVTACGVNYINVLIDVTQATQGDFSFTATYVTQAQGTWS